MTTDQWCIRCKKITEHKLLTGPPFSVPNRKYCCSCKILEPREERPGEPSPTFNEAFNAGVEAAAAFIDAIDDEGPRDIAAEIRGLKR